MNDPNTFGYQDMTGGAAAAGPVAPNASLAQYKYSTEEMRVLQECNRDSFFQRSLPMSTALGLAVSAAVQQGYLKANPRFGAFPKVTVAIVTGYFLGKLSYQQACADKLMALPGSYIGQLLRDRRDGKIAGSVLPQKQQQAPAAMLGASVGDIYSDAGPGRSLDLDSDRAGHVFSEDLTRPDPSGAGGAGAGAGEGGAAGEGAARPALSYDALRRQNRGEHADAKQDPYRVEAHPAAAGGRRPAPPPRATNAYGDVTEQ